MREWKLWAIRIVLAFVVTGTVQTVWADRVDLGFGEVDVERAIVAGHPNGIPPDSPANYVDPNVASSPFAGVGSLRINTFICSGTVISPNHVLTAAHCLDLNDDGVVDVTPGDVDFFLNAGASPSATIPARKFSIHPDFTGFGNPVVNDDVAGIKLSQPVPLGTPVYPLYVSVPNFTTPITMVGYGRSGNGVDGHTVDPNFHVKRTGRNILDAISIDDEDSGSIEVFMFDFDGPDATTNIFDVGTPGFDQFVEGTLGKALESTIGGGDSGGPSFVDVGNESLELLGINTFTFSLVGGPAAPLFGSGGGHVRADISEFHSRLDCYAAAGGRMDGSWAPWRDRHSPAVGPQRLTASRRRTRRYTLCLAQTCGAYACGLPSNDWLGRRLHQDGFNTSLTLFA